jgi:hypothetical protein
MKNEKLSSFRKFDRDLSERKLEKAELKASKNLIEATEGFHESQLKLQELQKKLIGITKENKIEREELKKAIIEQTKIVNAKETIFKKALGDEDIKDLEI